ncbi:MAG TPA: hypothetical protein VJI74_00165 [Candidatus Paceibacterota bacterium]
MWRFTLNTDSTAGKVIRTLGTILFFMGIFIFPSWVTLLLGSALLFFFRAFEIIAGGLLSDLLYGVPIPSLLGITFLTTLIFVFLSIAVFLIHRRLLV